MPLGNRILASLLSPSLTPLPAASLALKEISSLCSPMALPAAIYATLPTVCVTEMYMLQLFR